MNITEPRRLMREHRQRTEERLSLTAYFIACLARAVAENPQLNAFRRGRKLVLLEDVTISVIRAQAVEMNEQYLSVALQAAREAGGILKAGFYNYSGFRSKAAHDIVTETDLLCERVILDHIRRSFPGHALRSEEAGAERKDSEYCWIIDPLDGTSNFASGNPYFAVSIALAQKGRSLLGVVHSPLTEELYHAVLGQGAFLNGAAIRVSGKEQLSDSFVAVAYSAAEADIRQGIALLQRAALAARRAVANFAPALDLCNIARGRLEGLIDNGSTAEDHAAGSLILQEAGGLVQNLDASGWDVLRTGVVASNGRIHKALLGLVGASLGSASQLAL